MHRMQSKKGVSRTLTSHFRVGAGEGFARMPIPRHGTQRFWLSRFCIPSAILMPGLLNYIFEPSAPLGHTHLSIGELQEGWKHTCHLYCFVLSIATRQGSIFKEFCLRNIHMAPSPCRHYYECFININLLTLSQQSYATELLSPLHR